MSPSCYSVSYTHLDVYKRQKQYGRIIRNAEGMIEKIVEFKDCTEEQRKITEINTGIYCFDNQALFKHLEEIRNDNAQQEYYITDLVEIFNRHGLGVKAKIVEDSFEASGVNDKKELAQATRWMQKRINEHWMEEGVTLINPDSTYIGPDVVLGKDVTLYPNVYLEGNTVISDGKMCIRDSYIPFSLTDTLYISLVICLFFILRMVLSLFL